ncbi:16S rRNA (cytidine(1402)-2'-O)-methyltransferase [Candidatus Shapirobacteria bacterium CG09_land_8_20_14_0_10_49_15]|uniref:Ribosomal RNA small subunit methyltransferase I n=1 Tax=Candidatus Shapirobacteria bacterium CG09_land_8_20_14_0_10_49_15 TaxID=1974482 RepID=A0A2M6XAU6_9BACT|nr:MAG: 16S rRNA (cytidine(1402)-2'-O)-methyltransferase [Candidatus Shapirobacteria bacterium CG09_land_8_20_14_0_10_49_15]
MSKLYLVSTPIGNLADMTARAKLVLSAVDIIACEDTRRTGLLLQRLGLPKKSLRSFFEANEQGRMAEIIGELKAGQEVALVSNAGTPTISDPGYKLVRACVAQQIPVVPVPGASAALTALVASGLPTDRFLFVGFLPKKPGKREKKLRQLPVKTTIIIYESPFRFLKTLSQMQAIFGEIEVVIGRELTKLHEEIRREKISQALAHFEKTPPKGEFTLLFHLAKV